MPKLSRKQLTETRIDRAPVKTEKDGTKKVSYLWDSGIKGFGLRITAQGTKTFCLKFIAPSGEQAWIPLGAYTGKASLDAASKRAAEYRAMLDQGKDPRIETKKHLDVPTFESFVTSHLEAQKVKLRASSYRATEFYLEDVAGPHFKGTRINEVERFQVEDLVDKVATGWRPGMAKDEKPEKPTPTAANRLRSALSKLFAEAERKGYRTQGTNPCTLVEKQTEAKNRERFLNGKEITRLGKVLRKTLDENAQKEFPERTVPYAVAAIKLLMLTGARLNEILQLKWSHIDKARGVIRIEKHKTSGRKGIKELPLNGAVLSILKDLEKLPTRALGGDWVIQGNKHGTHMVNLQKVWDAVRKAAKCPDVRLHDLRHTFASVGVSEGLSLPMVGSLLGHSQPSVTNRYAHLDTDPRLQASEQISSVISAALG